jgi:hypothetical protein
MAHPEIGQEEMISVPKDIAGADGSVAIPSLLKVIQGRGYLSQQLPGYRFGYCAGQALN